MLFSCKSILFTNFIYISIIISTFYYSRNMHTKIEANTPSGAENREEENVTAQNETSKQRNDKLFDSIKKALFVVGSFLIIFVAARNSIVW